MDSIFFISFPPVLFAVFFFVAVGGAAVRCFRGAWMVNEDCFVQWLFLAVVLVGQAHVLYARGKTLGC